MMRINRRRILASLGIAATLLTAGLAPGVQAQAPADWPTKPVRIVMGYGAGGAGDLSWRIAAEKLSQRLGVQVIVENRPSAGAIVAGQMVKAAPADGYTFLHAATGNFAMTPSLFKSLPFDVQNDFEMVSELSRFSQALIGLPNAPYRTLPEIVTAAKASPGRIQIAVASIGSGQHIMGEMFKATAGIDVQLVPFKSSSDMLVALRGGTVQYMIDTLAPVLGQIRAGNLRAVAVTDPNGFPALPDAATFAAAGLKGFEIFNTWNGLAAPAGTPRAIVERMAREIAAVAAMPEVKSKLLEYGMVATSSTPAQAKQVLARDIAAFRSAIEKAGIEKQ